MGILDSRRPETALAPTHHAQQRIVADRQHQPLGKTRCRSAAERKTEMMDEFIEPTSASRPRCENRIGEAFSEDPTTAPHGIAPEASDSGDEAHCSPRQRQVGNLPAITAVYPAACCPTSGAAARHRRAAHDDRRRALLGKGADHGEAGRHQR